jgi:hypothetical protein
MIPSNIERTLEVIEDAVSTQAAKLVRQPVTLLGKLFRRVKLLAPLPTGQTPRARRVDGYRPSDYDALAIANAAFKRDRKNTKRAALR